MGEQNNIITLHTEFLRPAEDQLGFDPKIHRKASFYEGLAPFFNGELHTLSVIHDSRKQYGPRDADNTRNHAAYADTGTALLNEMTRYCHNQNDGEAYKPFDYIHMSTVNGHHLVNLHNLRVNMTGSVMQHGKWEDVDATSLIAPDSVWQNVNMKNCHLSGNLQEALIKDCIFNHCTFYDDILKNIMARGTTGFDYCDFSHVTDYSGFTFERGAIFHECIIPDRMRNYLLHHGADIQNISKPKAEKPKPLLPVVIEQPSAQIITPQAFEGKPRVPQPNLLARSAVLIREKQDNPDAPSVVQLSDYPRSR